MRTHFVAILLSIVLASCGGGGGNSNGAPASKLPSLSSYVSATTIGASSLDSRGLYGLQSPSGTVYINIYRKSTLAATDMYGIFGLTNYVSPEPVFSPNTDTTTIDASMVGKCTYNNVPTFMPLIRFSVNGSFNDTYDVMGNCATSSSENSRWSWFDATSYSLVEIAFADNRVLATALSTSAGLSYTRFGTWDVIPYSSGTSHTQVFAGMGSPTSAMPTGTYSYSGAFVGFVVDSSGVKYFIDGDVAISFDSSAATVTGSLTNLITRIQALPSASSPIVQGSFNDLSFTGAVASNSFSATSITVSSTSGSSTPTSAAAIVSGTASASLSGHFYGPSADELSLAFQMSGSDGGGGTVKLVATLAAKQ